MNYNVFALDEFKKNTKKLSKKYKKIKVDILELVNQLESDPHNIGIHLFNNCYKIRIPNSSIPTGKSGGFRVIIYYQVEDNIVLISIYSKTQKDNISDEDIEDILKNYLKK